MRVRRGCYSLGATSLPRGMAEIVERRKCPHCGLWNEITVTVDLRPPSTSIRMRGIVPKTEKTDEKKA